MTTLLIAVVAVSALFVWPMQHLGWLAVLFGVGGLFVLFRSKTQCPCGSGLTANAEYDARGSFLTYACDRCRKEKLSRYRTDVLTDANYWSDEDIEPD